MRSFLNHWHSCPPNAPDTQLRMCLPEMRAFVMVAEIRLGIVQTRVMKLRLRNLKETRFNLNTKWIGLGIILIIPTMKLNFAWLSFVGSHDRPIFSHPQSGISSAVALIMVTSWHVSFLSLVRDSVPPSDWPMERTHVISWVSNQIFLIVKYYAAVNLSWHNDQYNDMSSWHPPDIQTWFLTHHMLVTWAP